MSNPNDEGRVHVGTQGWVIYLDPKRPIAVTVTSIRLVEASPGSWRLAASCDDGSGDSRSFWLEDIHTIDEEGKHHAD